MPKVKNDFELYMITAYILVVKETRVMIIRLEDQLIKLHDMSISMFDNWSCFLL